MHLSELREKYDEAKANALSCIVNESLKLNLNLIFLPSIMKTFSLFFRTKVVSFLNFSAIVP